MFSDHNYGVINFHRHLKHKCAMCQSRMQMFVSHFVVLCHILKTSQNKLLKELLEAEVFD